MEVLFAAFESLPFIKTGGLDDVVYALPKAINQDKYQIRVVLPLHLRIKESHFSKMAFLSHLHIKSGRIDEEADVYALMNEGIEYLFIDNGKCFGRYDVYGYEDDAFRYSLFCLAVVEMLKALDYYPAIIHTHDYHTALIPAICKLKSASFPRLASIRQVFTIHNLAYQGIYDKRILFDYLDFAYEEYANGELRYNDCANLMKIGIVYADIITTVSRTYAKEILTSEYGFGLEYVLRYRKDDLYGIPNGIDTTVFDPSRDQIPCNYDASNVHRLKVFNKLFLQRKLSLKEDKDILLLGVVSRLVNQKGIGLLLDSLDDILKKRVQLVVVGNGETSYEYAFKALQAEHRGQVAYYCGYDETLSHQVYAGVDVLLMPSAYEPCGISQLIAMRYGTIPMVRETGGLKDSVQPLNEYDNTGHGFSFGPYRKEDFLNVFDYLYLQYYQYHDRFKMLMDNAMKYDVSFASSAKEYERIYDKVIENVKI